ncbi:MAG: hypothetical protein JWP44_2138, partial [Mucilaginibacter sp.]|nr:hypothetical protein [Mucilaginibacter sp.]
FKSLSNQGGIIVDALILVGHVLVCLILAIANRSWIWALSGVLVLVIGFSTCVMVIGGVH